MKIFAILIASHVALVLAENHTSIEKLKLVQVILRHGDRTPTAVTVNESYPLDPYANETWYPYGWDSLTTEGKRRSYRLGSFLKERYGEWLGNVYLFDRAVFRSSTTRRTIITAQLVAAGLFPPSEIERWHSNLDWQPIPVYSDPFTSETLYFPDLYCPRLAKIRNELEQSDENLSLRRTKLRGLFDYVSRNTGKELTQYRIAYIYHHLLAQSNMNVVLPEWTRSIFPGGKFEEVAIHEYYIQSYNKTMIKLHSGRWIREWLKNVDDYLSGSRSEPKAFIYAAHETNIAGILITLGVFEPHLPFYSNAVIFELSEIENEYNVKVFYKNRDNLQELLIPGCGGPACPLLTFRQLFADIISSEDPVVECRLD